MNKKGNQIDRAFFNLQYTQLCVEKTQPDALTDEDIYHFLAML